MVFKAVTGAAQKAFDIYNSADTFNENVMDALDVTKKHPNDYKNRIVLNWGDFRPSEVINMYGLLTKLVRSRWLDIGQVLF